MILRLAQLVLGLALYGAASALMVRSNLGLSPWNVFHQGIANRTSLSFGTVVVLTGTALLPVWIPLRQRVGVGTVANVLIIGAAADASLAWLPHVHGLLVRWGLLVCGIVLTGLASGIYIGARLEPGPRDGLMLGISKRTGWSVRATRTGIELSVLAIGFGLGGKVGVGTVIYALGIGPFAQLFLRLFDSRKGAEARASGTLAPVEQRDT